MEIEDIVVLVGGRGRRLGKITKKLPKPLIKINSRPFLEHLLAKLLKYNFKRIYLLCSYKKNKFYKLYHNKQIHNTKIICIDEGKQKGTGGALFKLKRKINKNFILLNGDTFFNINYEIIKKINITNKTAFVALTNINKSINNKILNNLALNTKNIVYFSKSKTYMMNGGVYLINKKIFKLVKNKTMSLENDILNKEIEKKKVIGKYFNDDFIDIGSKKKLSSIKKNNIFLKNKAFFLDRDGVINKDNGYIKNYKDFIFLKGAHDAIKYLNKKDYLVIILTNQAAIGKQLLTEKKLNFINNCMKKELFKKNKSYIDDIFYSPYYKYSKLSKYRKYRSDRKPSNGMFLKAIKKWNIDVNASIFIGDKITDKIAAKKSKVKFYFKKNISLFKQVKNII